MSGYTDELKKLITRFEATRAARVEKARSPQSAIHFAYRALPTVAAKGAAIRSGEKAPLYAIM